MIKIFKATYRPVDGDVLVLIVRKDKNSWRAFMCTNLSATAEEILEAVADRCDIGQKVKGKKGIEGDGLIRGYNLWANRHVFLLNR